jgi:hypothetical protein
LEYLHKINQQCLVVAPDHQRWLCCDASQLMDAPLAHCLQGASPAVDDAKAALSWQDLKMAAEAGFEQLLKMQEAAARQQVNPGSRRPGMTRAKGGGGSTAEAWVGPAQGMVLSSDFWRLGSSGHCA